MRVFRFNLLKSGGELRGGTHIVDEHNWPIALSVELCSQRVLGTCRKFTFTFPFSSQHVSVNCTLVYYILMCEENRVPGLNRESSQPSHTKAPFSQPYNSIVANTVKFKIVASSRTRCDMLISAVLRRR